MGAGGGVVGHRRAGADRLVVGVRVDQQQPAVGQRRHDRHSTRRSTPAEPGPRPRRSATSRADTGSTIRHVDYPELAARTRRFTPRRAARGDGRRRRLPGDLPALGRPGGSGRRALAASTSPPATERLVADPATLLGGRRPRPRCRRGERALRERLRLSAAGIGSYAIDPAGRVAVFAARRPAVPGRPGARRRGRGGRPSGRCSTPGPTRPGSGWRTSPTPPSGAPARAAGDRPRRHGHPARRRGRRASPGGWPSTSRRRSSAGSAATGGRRTGASVLAARVDESRLPRWHLHDPADPASPPTDVAYPPGRRAERRGQPAPAGPRRRLGRRALGPGDLPVPGRGALGGRAAR